MTHRASDVLTMVWLSRFGAIVEGLLHMPLPVVPAVRDDRRSRPCRRHPPRNVRSPRATIDSLREQEGEQVCMIGYSDSVKDGGYIAANWQLYDAQQRLSRLADQFSVKIVFFHGRGGALGRGGGPGGPRGPLAARRFGPRAAPHDRAGRSRGRALRRRPRSRIATWSSLPGRRCW